MTLRVWVAVLLLSLTTFSQQPAGEQFYQTIREGNLEALRAQTLPLAEWEADA